jgi:hypothetical protein
MVSKYVILFIFLIININTAKILANIIIIFHTCSLYKRTFPNLCLLQVYALVSHDTVLRQALVLLSCPRIKKINYNAVLCVLLLPGENIEV